MLTPKLTVGAEIEAKERDGTTALCVAAKAGHAGSVQLLLDRGADLEVKTRDGSTALIAAIRSSSRKTLWMLLHAGADPFTTYHYGMDLRTMPSGKIAILPYQKAISTLAKVALPLKR